MKNLLLVLLFIIPSISFSQNSNVLGKYFVITFPPNDQNAAPQSMDIFITASERTVVKLTDSFTGDVLQKVIEAKGVNSNNYVTTFSSSNGEISTADEITTHEEATFNSFILETDKPVSVYVLNSRRFSTDGYMALPVSAWGNENMICSYYEWAERTSSNWYSGGVIMAAEDNTSVTIDVNGTPGTRTWKGSLVGDRIQVKLDRGEVYMLTTDGTTMKGHDLTGTRISSDKPVGLVTFVQRTVMPQPLRTSRDHIVAMVPPLSSWGKEYTSIELAREGEGGDMYRFLASEDDTQIEVFWYDKNTGDPLGYRSYNLDGGQFEEYYGNADPGVQSIRGTVYIKANKPIFVMTYCYSQGWDTSTSQFDPFMFPTISADQFTKKTIFQTPSNKSGDNEYLTNKLNLIAIGDPDDDVKNLELLSSIKLDGRLITTLNSNFTKNRIPGTKFYWTTLDMDIGPHFIEGETPFGGYIYGFARYDTYAWPAATACNNLSTVDTLEPIITLKEEDCGIYKLIATELRNGDDDDDPLQIDEGIIDFPFITQNINFKEPLELDPEFEDMEWAGYPQDYVFNYIAEVEDKYADAYLEYIIPDATGLNIAYDTLVYQADSLIVVSPVWFGNNQVGLETNEKIVEVTSASDNTITIEDIQIKGTAGGVYRIAQGIDSGFELLPRETTTFTMVYTPEKEFLDIPENSTFGQFDVDTLIIETGCLVWEWPILGQGGEAYFDISDWTGDTSTIDQELRMINLKKKTEIKNWNNELDRQGTHLLRLYGIEIDSITDEQGNPADLTPFFFENSFSFNDEGDFLNEIVVQDDGFKVDFIGVLSDELGTYTRIVPFRTNAKNENSKDLTLNITTVFPVGIEKESKNLYELTVLRILDALNIELNSRISGTGSITIYNLQGATLLQMNTKIVNGMNSIPINSFNYPVNGSYFIILELNGEKIYSRF